jgi:hypothetical protein
MEPPQPPPPPAPMLKTPMAAIAGPGPDPKLRYKINLLFNDHFDYLHRESHCAIPTLYGRKTLSGRTQP